MNYHEMIAKGFEGEPYSMFFHVWPWIGLGAAIAKEYGCMTIPTVILFENGKELRRITSAAYSEEDILKFLEGR